MGVNVLLESLIKEKFNYLIQETNSKSMVPPIENIYNSKPDFQTLINADVFFDTIEKGYACPRCNYKIVIDDEDHVKILKFVVRGMNNLANIYPDKCSNCEIFIIINLITNPVSIEGFSDAAKWKNRINLLYDIYKIQYHLI